MNKTRRKRKNKLDKDVTKMNQYDNFIENEILDFGQQFQYGTKYMKLFVVQLWNDIMIRIRNQKFNKIKKNSMNGLRAKERNTEHREVFVEQEGQMLETGQKHFTDIIFYQEILRCYIQGISLRPIVKMCIAFLRQKNRRRDLYKNCKILNRFLINTQMILHRNNKKIFRFTIMKQLKFKLKQFIQF